MIYAFFAVVFHIFFEKIFVSLYMAIIIALNPTMPQFDEFFHGIRQVNPRCAK